MRQESTLMPVRRPWWRDDDTSLVNPRSICILVVVALTWAFSLMGLQRNPPIGLPSSVVAWSRTCPSCGTIESVATLRPTPGEAASNVYRLTIRMADGSIRRVERSQPMVPGAQVLVREGAVQPVPPANPAPAQQRQ